MPNRIKKQALQLKWAEVYDIVSAEIREILGLQIQCRVNIVEDTVWAILLEDCRLSLPMLHQLLQTTQTAQEDWMTILPSEGESDVNDIDMSLAEKLIGRHLSLSWEESLITSDSLWLVGVTKGPEALGL